MKSCLFGESVPPNPAFHPPKNRICVLWLSSNAMLVQRMFNEFCMGEGEEHDRHDSD
jgi:hypothetical protein